MIKRKEVHIHDHGNENNKENKSLLLCLVVINVKHIFKINRGSLFVSSQLNCFITVSFQSLTCIVLQ